MTSFIVRELSRTQFKSIVVMIWHVVEDVCKDELSKFWCGGNYDTMFWCMVLCERGSNFIEKYSRLIHVYEIL
jgi:hypothetical protein